MHLSEITHPNQLHGLSVKQLEQIAQQIRDKHLQTIAASGGHLGPGLGRGRTDARALSNPRPGS